MDGSEGRLAISGKISELESVRGVAALLVVFFHMPIWHGALYGLQLVRNSYLMVNLFFVLSGFVINLNYGERIRTVAGLTRFQLLRLGRLYPVHLLFLLVYLLLEVGKWLAARRYNVILPNGGAFERNTGRAFVEQLFLVQALGTKNADTFNTPSWSISVEFYAYLLFGVICLTAGRMYRTITFALIGAGCIVTLASLTGRTGDFSYMLQCGAGFFVGCLTAPISARVAKSVSPLWAATLIFALLLFLCFKTGQRDDWMVFPLSAAIIVAIARAREGVFRAVLRARPLTYLGLISYSVYMSHGFVLWSCNQFVRVILKRPEVFTAGVSYPQLSFAEACVGYALAIGITLAVSSITFRLVEDPCREWSRKILSPGVVRSAGAQ